MLIVHLCLLHRALVHLDGCLCSGNVMTGKGNSVFCLADMRKSTTGAPARRGPSVCRWHQTVVPSAVGERRRIHPGTHLHRIGAACVEAAPRRRVDRARHVAVQDDPCTSLLPVGVGYRDRRQQRLGVRVGRLGVDLPSADPISTIRPRYITAMRSLMWRTTDRS